MATRKPAETFPVAEFIRDEMVSRGWDVDGLAEQAGLSVARVQSLLNRRIPTLLDCFALGQAFGTSWTLWRRLSESEHGQPS